MHFGEFDHAHGFDLFGPSPVEGRFEKAGDLLGDDEGEE